MTRQFLSVWYLLFPGILFWAGVKAQSTEPDSVSEKNLRFLTDDYNWRIKQENLDGVYIPVDIQDAIVQLNLLIESQGREKFKSMTEGQASTKIHFSFGRWMIKNWSFYQGSRFSHYLRQKGISHPDDMAQFMIVTYHRFLNDRPLEIPERIEAIRERRKKEHEQRLERGTILNEWSEKLDSNRVDR